MIEESKIITPETSIISPTIDITPVQKPTGHVIARGTLESNGTITIGGCVETHYSAGFHIIEIPLTKEHTYLSFQWARPAYRDTSPPWYKGKCKQLMKAWIAEHKVRANILYQQRQQKVVPSGRRADLGSNCPLEE